MREVVSVHIGQAGIQVGTAAWQLMALEHGIDEYGHLTGCQGALSLNESIYAHTSNGNYIPRALFIDSEPGTIDAAAKKNPIFNKNRMVSGPGSNGCLFPSSYHKFAKTRTGSKATNAFRGLLEEADNTQAILLTHSMSGGTGSGFTTAFLNKMADICPKVPKLLFSIVPSMFKHDRTAPIIAPYNIALMSHHLDDSSRAFILFDNPSLYRMCDIDVIMPQLKYSQVNQLIAQVYDAVTSSYRLHTLVSANVHDIVTNLVPIPKMSYLCPSYAPVLSSHHREFENLTVSEVTNRCFESANQMLDVNPVCGEYVSTAFLYRGDVLPRDVNCVIYQTLAKKSVKFVPWLPTNVKFGITPAKPYTMNGHGFMQPPLTACQLSNHTALQHFWCKLGSTLKTFLRMKAYTHWFLRENTSMGDLCNACETLEEIASEYKSALKENATVSGFDARESEDIAKEHKSLLKENTPHSDSYDATESLEDIGNEHKSAGSLCEEQTTSNETIPLPLSIRIKRKHQMI